LLNYLFILGRAREGVRAVRDREGGRGTGRLCAECGAPRGAGFQDPEITT